MAAIHTMVQSSDSLFWWVGSGDRSIFAYNLCAVVQESSGLTRRFDVHLNSVRGSGCHPLFFLRLNCSSTLAATRFPTLSDPYALVKASLLDVPFIFNLMMTGSELGVFSDGFMRKAGAFRLFWWISRRILAQTKFSSPLVNTEDWYLIAMKTNEIGFFTVKSSRAANGDAIKVIVLFALEPQHQNRGHGTTVLRSFVDAQSKGTTVFVHCTKYARAMQRVLKNLRFVRNAKAGYPLEEYSLVTL